MYKAFQYLMWMELTGIEHLEYSINTDRKELSSNLFSFGLKVGLKVYQCKHFSI